MPTAPPCLQVRGARLPGPSGGLGDSLRLLPGGTPGTRALDHLSVRLVLRGTLGTQRETEAPLMPSSSGLSACRSYLSTLDLSSKVLGVLGPNVLFGQRGSAPPDRGWVSPGPIYKLPRRHQSLGLASMLASIRCGSWVDKFCPDACSLTPWALVDSESYLGEGPGPRM